MRESSQAERLKASAQSRMLWLGSGLSVRFKGSCVGSLVPTVLMDEVRGSGPLRGQDWWEVVKSSQGKKRLSQDLGMSWRRS